MNKCKKCGTEFEGKFCPECGEPWLLEEEKVCPKCKAVLKASAKFCSECGYSFETQSAPAPVAPQTSPAARQPQKAGKPVTAGTKKLYAAVCILPAALLALFSVLLFLFFLTPVAVMPGGEFMGQKIPSMSYGNVYESSNYAGMSFTGSMTALIVFAALALFITFLLLISCVFSNMRDKRFTIAGKKIFLRNILTAIGYVLFFVLFLIACIMMGQIASDDGGLGLMKAGTAPILVLVFTLICSLAALVCAFVGAHLRKTYPALVKAQEAKIAAAKPTKVETWIKEHKKLSIFLAAVLIIAIVVAIAVPVGLANRHNGTYYAYNGETEEYNMEKFYKLSGGTWIDEDGERGKITFDGEKVTLSYDPSNGMDKTGSSTTTREGTIVGDVLKVGGTVYAKEGHEHNMKNRECNCGIKDNSSEGLVFERSGDHWVVRRGSCTDTDIVISAWHEDAPVTEIGTRAFVDCEGLTSVTIGSGVTLISEYAFSGCSGLTSIDIPDSVTKIGDHAFSGCSGLTSVTIIGSGRTWIGDYAFSGCSGLESVTIGSGVTSIGDYAFSGCSGLTSIEIPNSVTWIGERAFYGCSGLTSVTIPDSVTSIGWYAFGGCSGLTSITIPDSVTEIGWWAFYDCSGLTSIEIPDSVTEIGPLAFGGCSNLTDIQFTGTIEEWQAIKKDLYWDDRYWDDGTADYTVTCTDGTVKKDGTVTYFE